MAERALETVPSEEATFADQKTFGVVAGRTHVEIAPKYGGDFVPGDIIRLEIPSQAYLDPNEFYIHFRTGIIAGAPGANTHGMAAADQIAENKLTYLNDADSAVKGPHRDKTVQFVPGIQSIFNRVRLLAGSVVLEDIQDYNVLYRMLLEGTASPEWRKGDGFHNEGVYDPEDYEQKRTNANFHANRGEPGGNPGHFYSVRPLFGLFAAGKYIPLKLMGQLTIELYLENAAECLWSTSSCNAEKDASDATAQIAANHVALTSMPHNSVNTEDTQHLGLIDDTLQAISTDFPNASYRVHDVRMHVPFVHPIESYDQALMKQVEDGEISIFHSTWSTHTRQIPNPTKQTLSFQERALSLKGGLACMRNSPEVRAIDSDFTFPANGIESYQWKIGSEYIPSQAIDCKNGGSRALAELKKGLGNYDDSQVINNIRQYNFLPDDTPGQLDTFNYSELIRGTSQPSSFFMALDLEKSPGQASGFDSAASSVDIELNMVLRNHSDVVPTYDANKIFRGAFTGAKWQPSKKLIKLSQVAKNGATIATGFQSAKNASFHDADLVASTPQYVTGVPEGVMCDRLLKTTYNGGTQAAPAIKASTTYSIRDAGVYSRVYFFANIDQVLRLTAIGRMEIVR